MHDATSGTMWTLDGREEKKTVKIRELSTSVVGRAAISGEAQVQIFGTEHDDRNHGQVRSLEPCLERKHVLRAG